ncbi:PilZ domain-containing protein [Oleidesulfovibrio sp.]|uniref:PilZ domain-containing protein n=1 Tax=Oleidesulfovibrio sp. TaxID=2909707 RepID=UPI003A8C32C7
MHILVIAKDSNEAAPYIRILEKAQAKYHIAHDNPAALQLLREIPFHGVLIDMPTLLRMGGKGRHDLQNVLALYPTLHARPDKNSGLAVLGHDGNPEEAILHFLTDKCASFSARTARRENRVDIHYNILLSTSPLFPPQSTVKTITMNISILGCFVFLTADWQVDTQVWLQFVDLKDKTPIVAKTTQVQRWGKGFRVPGIGLEFISVSDEQVAELQATLSRSPDL